MCKKQKVAYCTICSHPKCNCNKKLKKMIDLSTRSETNRESEERRGSSSTSHSESEINVFTDELPIDQHYEAYGCNRTRIPFPMRDDKEKQHTWLARARGEYRLPDYFSPDFHSGITCSHGHQFDPTEENLIQISSTVIIFTETSEDIFNNPTYGRPTVSENGSSRPCKCIQQADCDKFLLWHLGKGKMVCYLTLNNFMLKFKSGHPMNAWYESRKMSLWSIGLSTHLTYKDWLRSVSGYFFHLEFKPEVWICPTCKTSPDYFVADGKESGPTKRKVEHIRELGQEDREGECLSQGSQFRDRCFVPLAADRKKILMLLTNEVTLEDFSHEEILSESGQLIKQIVSRLNDQHGDIPSEYKRLLTNCIILYDMLKLKENNEIKSRFPVISIYVSKEIIIHRIPGSRHELDAPSSRMSQSASA